MDRLARNAMLARQANMSYGKWKALQPVVELEPEPVIPDGWKRCEACGKPFKPKGGGQRFCEYVCRERYYWRKKNKKRAEYMRLYREQKRSEEDAKEKDEP